MNRFGLTLGCPLALLAAMAAMLGGCPTAGNDGSSANENLNENSQTAQVANTAPVASAGEDQTVRSGALVVLNAGGTADADGDRLQFLWGQTGGSPTVVLQDGFSSAPRFFAPTVTANTVLTFRLTVGDGQAISTDDVSITVTP